MTCKIDFRYIGGEASSLHSQKREREKFTYKATLLILSICQLCCFRTQNTTPAFVWGDDVGKGGGAGIKRLVLRLWGCISGEGHLKKRAGRYHCSSSADNIFDTFLRELFGVCNILVLLTRITFFSFEGE